MTHPEYFEAIRAAAAARWDQLEADPELAGPWHQLFRQVQSPRHVLSELLQNADDAGATEASVSLDQSTFHFEHNGEDFAEDHFRSLCRFGYSNKRTLHTIGFRGIGFKSTFSLGETVELFSPSLAVQFHQSRFTEPVWINSASRPDGLTRVRVAITDTNRLREIEKNLEDWRNHPLALLFFRNLRSLQIGDTDFRWRTDGRGPVGGSEWFRREENGNRYLLVRSTEEPFPEDALEEIRKERSLGSGEDIEMPPCRIELVLGAEGRLHVVLPTGVKCDLPFACNAPFIQDPARVLIKEPSTSPTNRWLLQRAGRLSADAMQQWLGQGSLCRKERCLAYALMPNVDREDSSLEGECAGAVELAFANQIKDCPILLACPGTLLTTEECSILPELLFGVWEEEYLAGYFGTTPLAPEIDAKDRRKLLDWGLVKALDRSAVAESLRRKAPAMPDGWDRLFMLWRFVAPDFKSHGGIEDPHELHLLPVTGLPRLERASELVRLRKADASLSDEDWEFLNHHLRVVDAEWFDFLKAERTRAKESQSSSRQQSCDQVLKMLERVGFADASSGGTLVNQVANSLFATGSGISIADAVRLAQIAARWKADVDDRFRYVIRKGSLRDPAVEILVDFDSGLEEILPGSMRDLLLHESYSTFSSCSADEWQSWVRSGRSRLFQLPRMVAIGKQWLRSKEQVQRELDRREFAGLWHSYYVKPSFVLVDWDFSPDLLAYWEEKAKGAPGVWIAVVSRLIASLGDKHFWEPIDKADWHPSPRGHQRRTAMSAVVLEIARNGQEQAVVKGGLRPTWLTRLRDLPCLPDTRGFPHKPSDLLRRTSATEAFIEVEPFLRHDLDTEEARPFLDLLGVRCQPLGPGSVLSRLRALAKAEEPPLEELGKWYRRLDQIADSGSPRDREIIAEAFRTERLILTANGRWETSAGVFLSASEHDAPGTEMIHPSLANLHLWKSIGVAERPTSELAIRWLETLPSAQVLDNGDLPRVVALLGRHGRSIWEETGHWLSLDGRWGPVGEFVQAVNTDEPTIWSALFPLVKAATADFRMLSASELAASPFSELAGLASRLELRPGGIPAGAGDGEPLPWLHEAGQALRRVCFEAYAETRRVHALAEALAATRLLVAPRLSVTPFLDGTPAGQSVDGEVAWLVSERRLCVRELSEGRLARLVPEEVARVFDRADIRQALAFAYGRPPRTVASYFEENFDFDPGGAPLPTAPDTEMGPVDPGDSLAGWAADEGGEQRFHVDDEVESPGGVETEAASGPTAEPGRHVRKASQPDLMERFLRRTGFKAESERRYRREDGSVVEKVDNNIAPWEGRNPLGDVVRRYWPRAQCLERDGLEIPHEVWALVQKRPDLVSLVLADPEGRPVELFGAAVLSRVETGEIGLYPATYRLACRDLD